MRTIVYIDGFNLYYRQLKKKRHLRWLNLKLLCDYTLGSKAKVERINYYTARVSSKISQDSPRHQNTYISALETIPEISIHYGNFLINEKWAALAQPAKEQKLFLPWPDVVRVRKIEEKGSDVNLGVHLVRDAFMNKFETAVVLSNDTDLVEPIRIVAEDLKLTVGLISPVSKPADDLVKYTKFVRRIRLGHLRKSQFPDHLILGDETLSRPEKWKEAQLPS